MKQIKNYRIGITNVRQCELTVTMPATAKVLRLRIIEDTNAYIETIQDPEDKTIPIDRHFMFVNTDCTDVTFPDNAVYISSGAAGYGGFVFLELT